MSRNIVLGVGGGVGGGLEVVVAFDQFGFAKGVVAAVGVVVEDGGVGAGDVRAGEKRGDWFEAVEVEGEVFQGVIGAAFLGDYVGGDRSIARGRSTRLPA